MRVKTGYKAIATYEQDIRIIYKCSNCGVINVDDNHYVKLRGSAQGGLWANREQLKEDARLALGDERKRIIEEINARNYKKLELDCQCRKCGTKTIWSDYSELGKMIFDFILHNSLGNILGILVLAFCGGRIAEVPIVAVFILPAISAPFIQSSMKNKKIQKEINQLPKEYLPQIYFKK